MCEEKHVCWRTKMDRLEQPRLCGEYGLAGRHGLHKCGSTPHAGEYYTHRDTGDYPTGSTPRIRGVHLPTSKLTSQIPVPGTTLIIH